MKLQNYTTSWFMVALLLLISAWATVFYYALLDEIYDSIDDGLDNQKQLIIQKAATDSTLLNRVDFEESGYAITQLPAAEGMKLYDHYVDTTMYMQNEDDYEPVRLLTTVFRRGDKYYRLQVATSMVEEDDLVAELLYSLLWLFLGLIISIILLNKVLLRRIWKPFYHLLDQLKSYRLDSQEDIKVKNTRIDEFRLLNENIETLLTRSKNTYNSQKQFIENASHELQTPLAISINKLEALAEHNNFSEADMNLLGSALDNLERMTRLNRSLLLLSKIENNQFVEAESININEVVKKLVSDFEDQLEFRNIDISISEQQPCTINMNADLAVVLLTNLIKNAIVHNHQGGSINISIQSKALTIENTGQPSPLDDHNLFSRFHKQERSSSSTGLGLAIVKAIVQLNQFAIRYSFNNKHSLTIFFR